MPLREYLCSECGHQFEEIVSQSDRERMKECPQCQRLTAEVLPALVGNYSIAGNNSASQRPKSGLVRKRSK